MVANHLRPSKHFSIYKVLSEIKNMVPTRKYLVHPHYIIMTLVIASITALFLGFTGSYIYNRVQQGIAPIQIPTLFYFNSLIIIASSVSLLYAKKRYEDDDTAMFKVALWVTLGLTFLFLVMQIQAWNQLIDLITRGFSCLY